ncbi:Clp protease ClpP [Clostridium botulinum]|uniref:head maturation protease, ClpP-related n=1 Tax=Clostridium botulinum TaxID=1491 RepID=UPI0009B26795|nr:head maturation protease, ClpP-related [Clostridium botulinum]MBY7003554.1 Clp protease ClpP [Clostridium botulinum]MCR1145972.1 Clp protease ClpP [Clostridium botulinum]NFH93155.1 Clp protease ClpP [Clostridium botulinum]NFH96929.1 Clp protease ClpP [Clostridium botulinum]NFI24570.1 Clp protease ClpP [Clostridium botulinum]
MKINVKGTIISNDDKWIYDWFEMDATSPRDIEKALEQVKKNEEIEVVINSGGGSVFAGSEIYSLLKDHKGKITGKIVGLAASAASVIAMGCETLKISPTAQIMIHRASMVSAGNSEDFEKGAEILKGIDKSIANAYILKTGLKQDELLDLMAKETWLDAKTAKEKGFIDEIMFDEDNKIVASFDSGIIPPQIISKLRNELKNKKIQEKENIKDEEGLKIAKAKLQLQLKL